MEDQFEKAFEDDLWGQNEDTTIEEEPESTEILEDIDDVDTPSQDEDYMTTYLRRNGIDRSKIRFELETGDIEEVNFDDLSNEEKLSLLDSINTSPITDEELLTLNYLRANNMSILDFANWQRDLAVQDYLLLNQVPSYDIDSLTDDEVFAYDLISRFGDNITNEEIDAEIEKAKENLDAYEKRVALLRDNYKSIEDLENAAKSAELELIKKQEFNHFVDEMVGAAQNIQEIQGIELEDTDREQVLDFLLKENPDHRTGFSQLLENPEALFKMAWFYLYGDTAFNTTVDYFKKELAKARRDNTQMPKPKVVTRNKNKNSDPYGLNEYFN